MLDRVVGGYRILEQIGQGSMGTVYKGVDTTLEREVAIKELRPELVGDQDFVERFRIEAIALTRLNHPNIVTLYNLFRDGEQFFVILEMVQGETLDKLIKRCGTIPWQTAVPLICQALSGLEHAHILKVIHRDIKPANLILTRTGILKLMDFGIARILETQGLTQVGHLVGTLKYMSPEQIRGQEVSVRSDIYAVGMVLYEMLTGHVPFESNSDYELLKSQLEEAPTLPREFMPQRVPQSMEAAVLRALAKAPEDRFHSAAAFRAGLEAIRLETSFFKTISIGGEPGQNSPKPPGTGFEDTSPPFVPKAHRSPASSSMPADRPAHHRSASYWSYLRRNPRVVGLSVLIGIVAVLVGIAHQPLQSPLTAVGSPPAAVEQLNKTALTDNPPVIDSVTPPRGEPGVASGGRPAKLIETATPIPESALTDPKQEQQSDQKQKPDNGRKQRLAENPPARLPAEQPPVPAPVPAPAALVPGAIEQPPPSVVGVPPSAPAFPALQKSKPAQKKSAARSKPSTLAGDTTAPKSSVPSHIPFAKGSKQPANTDKSHSSGWKVRDSANGWSIR